MRHTVPHSHTVPHRPRPRRTLLANLLRAGDPKAASRAAGSMAEFVARQLGLLATRDAQGRPHRQPAHIDPRLWLDEHHWLAWAIDGDLVSVEELEPGCGRGSPEVRRVTDEEQRQVFACGRLVDQVIALYRGDTLDRGPVHRYMAHFDLRRALQAALARAPATIVAEPEVVASDDEPPSGKTRHHPAGNFILFRPPASLAPFFAILPGAPVQAAFPDRRHALRRLKTLRHVGDGLVVARVCGAVDVQPVFRAGLRLRRFADELIAMVHTEPRVVLPELHAAWVPRYVEGEDGSWTLQQFRLERTVRTGWHEVILRQLGEQVDRVAPIVEENHVRRSLDEPELCADDEVSLALMQKAGRRLPQTWLQRIGMEPGSLPPPLRVLQAKSYSPPASEEGHWLRAPFEFRAPGASRPQRQLVELRIDNLADLLELMGFKLRFLLIRESPRHEPRWVLPIRAVECLAAGVA
ncbi:MAG TPA: hypothetical protein VFZ65_04570 [Planctomycetota bacterium]|nr:hypothetical protein [Planctomycetota bacterium]